jgi:hypothetical protein
MGCVAAAVLICCVRPARAAGASEDVVVHLLPRWKAGDVCDLEITRTFEERRHDRVTSARWTTRVRLVVRQAGADGYVLQWRFLGQDGPPSAFPTQATDALKWIAQPIEFEARLDARGHVTALLQPAIARARLGETVRTESAKLPPKTRDAVLALFRGASFGDEAVDRLLTGDLRTLTIPLGQRFRVGRVFRYTDKVPSPTGEGTVDARGEISLTKFDRAAGAAGAATINANMTADAEFARAKLKRGFRQPLTETQAAAVRDVEISVGNRVEHVIDVATGWPVRLRKRDVVQLGEIRDLEGIQVTATLKPATSPAAADAR